MVLKKGGILLREFLPNSKGDLQGQMFTDKVASPDKYRIYCWDGRSRTLLPLRGFMSVYMPYFHCYVRLQYGEGECIAHTPLTKANMEYVK